MIDPAADPAHPGHAAWHARQGLPDPDGLLATFWARLESLTAADATQVLLATRDLSSAPLIAARREALRLMGAGSLELELDEFRLHETLDRFVAREPAAVSDEAARKILYGTLRDALLAFAAVQTAGSLARAEYAVLTDAWWAGAG